MKNTWPYLVLFLTLVVLGVSIWAFVTRCGNNEKFGDGQKCFAKGTKFLYEGDCSSNMILYPGQHCMIPANTVWYNFGDIVPMCAKDNGDLITKRPTLYPEAFGNWFYECPQK